MSESTVMYFGIGTNSSACINECTCIDESTCMNVDIGVGAVTGIVVGASF